MAVDVLIGLQWGDEGKGKIVDLMAPGYDVVARFQGGPNAGHTIVVNKKKYVLHSVPSGIIHPGIINLIGNGVVIDPVTLKEEIEHLQEGGIDVTSRLIISDKAHVIFPGHKAMDASDEKARAGAKIGSTLKGIGPSFQDKYGREGLRTGDLFSEGGKEKIAILEKKYNLYMSEMEEDPGQIIERWHEATDFLGKLRIESTEYWINEALNSGKNVLAEGAQGTLLDIDFGTYPYVTSSNTISAAACTGLGIAPSKIRNVYGIMKAYTTRVGNGPFPTELLDSTGSALQKAGNEFGATTGRPRRCGWLDLTALRYAIMLNGVTHLIVTKADVLSALSSFKVAESFYINGQLCDKIKPEVFTRREPDSFSINFKTFPSWDESKNSNMHDNELPAELASYIDYIEKKLSVSVCMVSTGPGREETVSYGQVAG